MASRTPDAVAKIGLNKKSVTLAIPRGSPLFDRFAKVIMVEGTPTFRPVAAWRLQLVTRDGKLVLQLLRVDGVEEKSGQLTKGSWSSSSQAWQIVAAASRVRGAKRIGAFRTTPTQLLQDAEGDLTFAIPEDRKPPIVRGKAAKEKRGRKPISAHTAPAHEEPPSRPQREADTPFLSGLPGIRLGDAVRAINGFKAEFGDQLQLRVKDDGSLGMRLEVTI